MDVLKSVIILLFVTTSALSFQPPGTELATMIENVFAGIPQTRDICILHDTSNPTWRDLLDDFASKLSGKFALNRMNLFGNAARRCDFYLTYLDSRWRREDFSKMADRFLEESYWNRYGRFVFVILEDEWMDFAVLEWWVEFVDILGIVNSVLICVRKDLTVPLKIQFDYFSSEETFLKHFEEIETFFKRDYSKDFKGHIFSALLFPNEPYLFVISPGKVVGIQGETVETFCKHVNATLRIWIPEENSLEDSQVVEFLARGSVSIVNGFGRVPKYTEIELSQSQSGLCLLVPEIPVTSIFRHLLRPFAASLSIAIVVSLIIVSVISKIFRNNFPRGILNQLFFESHISEYKKSKVERFLLFSLSLTLFLLSESYLAKLFQFLFNNQYEPHLNSIQELLATNAVIHSHTPFFLTHLATTFPQLKNRLQLITNFTQPTDDLTICTFCHFAEGFVLSDANFDRKTGFPLHYVLPEKVPLATNAYTHARKQPFSVKFAEFQGHLREAGLLDHWFEIYQHLWLAVPSGTESGEVRFEHLVSLWKLLVLGYGVGLASFTGEFVMHLGLKRLACRRFVRFPQSFGNFQNFKFLQARKFHFLKGIKLRKPSKTTKKWFRISNHFHFIKFFSISKMLTKVFKRSK